MAGTVFLFHVKQAGQGLPFGQHDHVVVIHAPEHHHADGVYQDRQENGRDHGQLGAN